MKKTVALCSAFLLMVSAMSGCSTSNNKPAEQQPSAPATAYDEEKTADVIVVGAGGAGLSAAIALVWWAGMRACLKKSRPAARAEEAAPLRADQPFYKTFFATGLLFVILGTALMGFCGTASPPGFPPISGKSSGWRLPPPF